MSTFVVVLILKRKTRGISPIKLRGSRDAMFLFLFTSDHLFFCVHILFLAFLGGLIDLLV